MSHNFTEIWSPRQLIKIDKKTDKELIKIDNKLIKFDKKTDKKSELGNL